MRAFTLTLFGIGAIGAGMMSPGATPEEIEFFEKKIRPVLAEQCWECHGAKKQQAELRLDTREGVMKGSDLGPVVVPGKPEESSLIKSIRHEQGVSKMPEKKDKMPEEQIAALAEWIAMGAPWPEGSAPVAAEKEELAKTHWAFQPVRKLAPPGVADEKGWAISPIDRFVLEKLAAKGIAPSPLASRAVLIRRATFGLTGLPPTAQEVEDFEKDPSPLVEAFAKVVDRLLASPRYGERWARHWLDVARYADTKGYVFQENREYPFAFTYRDWVIRALNDDLPYDQFLIRQIAADVEGSGASKDDLAAMGFLTLGRRFLNNIHDITDDRIDTVTRGTMALTVSCARCHDHKFDPISMKDYYAMHGVFLSSEEPGDPGKLPELPGSMGNEAYLKERAKRQEAIHDHERKLAAEFSLTLAYSTGLIAPLPREAVEMSFTARGRGRYFTRKARDERRNLENRLAQVETHEGAPARAHVMYDKAQPAQARVLLRGNPGRPGEEVPRRFLSLLGGEEKPFTQGSGRLEMARMIASKENPLTARVMVNRVWGRHFGKPLVTTPGDFGTKGDVPVYPELLDYLATKFVEDGWSLKKLHRTIMLSATYMQTSDLRPEVHEMDPDNRLLARQNRQRLDWEALRDSLLAVADELDAKMGGKSVNLFSEPFTKRRAVYGYIDRQNLPGTFRTFDFANPDQSNPQRYVTTVPPQALFMMNNPFVVTQAKALVNEPAFASSGVDPSQVQMLYERVFARQAEPHEVEAGLAFVRQEMARPEPKLTEKPLWHYGYGKYDAEKKTVEFTPLPHWTGSSWQGGSKLPDAKLGWLTLNAEGGHPARDLAIIRRFVSPRDMTVTVTGQLHRGEEKGNGIVGRIVTGTRGQVTEVTVERTETKPLGVEQLELKEGETLDFIVDSRGDEGFDSFVWKPVVKATAGGGEWKAKEQFAGPPEKPNRLSPWEKYAQVLLQTNEFVFVD